MPLIQPVHLVVCENKNHRRIVCSDGTQSSECTTKVEIALEANRLHEAGKILDEEVSYLVDQIDQCGLPMAPDIFQAFGPNKNMVDIRDAIIALFGDDSKDSEHVDASDKKPSSLGSTATH